MDIVHLSNGLGAVALSEMTLIKIYFFLRDLRTPFGGSRMSGPGRQGGRYALEFWTELKLVCMAYGEESRDG